MPLRYPADFLSLRNFQVAWERIIRGSNVQYKRFFAHLLPSYQFARDTLLADMVSKIRQGIYRPSKATTVYFPKPTRILRPITLLSLNDQIVYQAIANYVATRFYRSLLRNYQTKTFGAMFAGQGSLFFYRPWKKAYRAFNAAIKAAYHRGNSVVADFDLVSFFDLIDHQVLRDVLRGRVRNEEVLQLLSDCLREWTSGNPKSYVRGHGIPQGPEPSAFLAEIFLSEFDKTPFKQVTYLRYVDDVKLLGKDFSPVRRALLRLDLRAKRLGLVPQAQKIEVRRVPDIDAELKSVPSSIAGATGPVSSRPLTKGTIRRLRRLLKNSLARQKSDLQVTNETHFKFALYRLPAYKSVLRLITPLFHVRPDLSPVLSHYASRFSGSASCASLLHNALKGDPVFDAAAGDYVLALDQCAPQPEPRKYRRFVSRLMARSEEKSLLLDSAVKLYSYKRLAKASAAQAIANESSATTAGLLIHRLAFDGPTPHMIPRDLREPIRHFARSSQSEDLARYCAYLMLSGLGVLPTNLQPAGALLVKSLGLSPVSAKTSLLPGFFKDLFGLSFSHDWERLLGRRAHSETQRRTVLIRGLWASNPSILITTLDSFNDLLVQRFSKKHTRLAKAFRKAAGKKQKIPDYGNWLASAPLGRVLPKACPILGQCHTLRVRADIAHATHKRTGQFTHPISYSECRRMLRRLAAAYKELLIEWTKL